MAADNGWKLTKIGHVMLGCTDMRRSLDFYNGLLGLEIKAEIPGFAFLNTGAVPCASANPWRDSPRALRELRKWCSRSTTLTKLARVCAREVSSSLLGRTKRPSRIGLPSFGTRTATSCRFSGRKQIRTPASDHRAHCLLPLPSQGDSHYHRGFHSPHSARWGCQSDRFGFGLSRLAIVPRTGASSCGTRHYARIRASADGHRRRLAGAWDRALFVASPPRMREHLLRRGDFGRAGARADHSWSNCDLRQTVRHCRHRPSWSGHGFRRCACRYRRPGFAQAPGGEQSPDARRTTRATLVAAALTYATLLLGAYVATSGSSLACPQWPLCNNTVIPTGDWRQWIGLIHRILAAAMTIAVIWATWTAYRAKAPRQVRGLLHGAAALTVIEIIVGALNPILLVPPAVAVAHLTVATVIWILLTGAATISMSADRRGIPAGT